MHILESIPTNFLQGSEKHHAEQAVDDGGDALQGLGGQADGAHQRRVALGVLRQINRPAHANRDSDKQRNQRNHVKFKEYSLWCVY